MRTTTSLFCLLMSLLVFGACRPEGPEPEAEPSAGANSHRPAATGEQGTAESLATLRILDGRTGAPLRDAYVRRLAFVKGTGGGYLQGAVAWPTLEYGHSGVDGKVTLERSRRDNLQRLSELPPYYHVLWAPEGASEGLECLVPMNGQSTLHAGLPTEMEVSGRVTIHGWPVENVTVMLSVAKLAPTMLRSLVTNADGWFYFRGLPGHEATHEAEVTVTADHYSLAAAVQKLKKEGRLPAHANLNYELLGSHPVTLIPGSRHRMDFQIIMTTPEPRVDWLEILAPALPDSFSFALLGEEGALLAKGERPKATKPVADGVRFWIGLIPPGPDQERLREGRARLLLASKGQLLELAVKAEGDTLRARLADGSGAWREGQVLEGRMDPPPAEGEADAWRVLVDAGPSTTRWSLAEATVGPDGSFTVTGLPEGALQVAVVRERARQEWRFAGRPATTVEAAESGLVIRPFRF